MTRSLPELAVDALGGDRAPEALVAGSLRALRQLPDLRVILVGEPERLEPLLDRASGLGQRLRLEPAQGAISMDAHPARATRSQPRASINVAVELVAAGQADACFSAGNSGAAMAAALTRLRRQEAVARPAIGTPFPNRLGGTTLLVDAGAQVDCRAEWLADFARLGCQYARMALGVAEPKVGLLSNGEEPTKGNALVQAAHERLGALQLDYRGPVEPRGLLSGEVDVVVADGFVGNIALKSAEGVAEVILAALRDEARSDLRSRLGAALLLPALRRLGRRLDWRQVGAAPLLGVRGLVFIGHGRSDAGAVSSALTVAAAAVRSGLAATLRPQPARAGAGA